MARTFTPQQQQTIVSAIAARPAGQSVEKAARGHGINPETYYRWSKQFGTAGTTQRTTRKRTTRGRRQTAGTMTLGGGIDKVVVSAVSGWNKTQKQALIQLQRAQRNFAQAFGCATQAVGV
jgi:transposase-like protein